MKPMTAALLRGERIDKLRRELEDAKATCQALRVERDEARALLREVEWGGKPYAPKSHCPSCHALYLDGAPDDHDDACALKAALTEGRLP